MCVGGCVGVCCGGGGGKKCRVEQMHAHTTRMQYGSPTSSKLGA